MLASAITGNAAFRLARFFGTAAEFWLNLQRDFDLERATIALGERLAQQVEPRAA